MRMSVHLSLIFSATVTISRKLVLPKNGRILLANPYFGS